MTRSITHVMLDIETMGTRPGAIITSVAFVRFTDEAHCAINLSVPEQQSLGMEADPATMEWWAKQDPVAWELATRNPLSLHPAANYLAEWLAWVRGDSDLLLWCHGATFDAPLLGELYRRLGIVSPWQFWAVRDTRTLYDLAGVDLKAFAVPPPHVALNDAIAQTRAANEALRRIGTAMVAQGVAA